MSIANNVPEKENSEIMMCRCGKILMSDMEIEYSAHLSEFFCSPDCATDRYFDYMASTPVDFENPLPDNIVVDENSTLIKMHPTN